MAPTRAKLRILYLQIREDRPTRIEELQEFVFYSGLAQQQFTTLNVFDTPCFGADTASKYDAVFIGGSSDASVLKPSICVMLRLSVGGGSTRGASNC
jgi:GMP synthase (glutamine-hydrolysing)